eukprot:gnl/Chilomastix_cuspidata/2905.p1 GENE.gnl/Chilomastix_cuspidata/2905~~gnl/Chilomastix_cuspidata/2905.p1  ORF type:complete len:2962 (+),score=469.68 gnl/Chilomastix_cuspidata/2905:757-8886(+)
MCLFAKAASFSSISVVSPEYRRVSVEYSKNRYRWNSIQTLGLPYMPVVFRGKIIGAMFDEEGTFSKRWKLTESPLCLLFPKPIRFVFPHICSADPTFQVSPIIWLPHFRAAVRNSLHELFEERASAIGLNNLIAMDTISPMDMVMRLQGFVDSTPISILYRLSVCVITIAFAAVVKRARLSSKKHLLRTNFTSLFELIEKLMELFLSTKRPALRSLLTYLDNMSLFFKNITISLEASNWIIRCKTYLDSQTEFFTDEHTGLSTSKAPIHVKALDGKGSEAICVALAAVITMSPIQIFSSNILPPIFGFWEGSISRKQQKSSTKKKWDLLLPSKPDKTELISSPPLSPTASGSFEDALPTLSFQNLQSIFSTPSHLINLETRVKTLFSNTKDIYYFLHRLKNKGFPSSTMVSPISLASVCMIPHHIPHSQVWVRLGSFHFLDYFEPHTIEWIKINETLSYEPVPRRSGSQLAMIRASGMAGLFSKSLSFASMKKIRTMFPIINSTKEGSLQVASMLGRAHRSFFVETEKELIRVFSYAFADGSVCFIRSHEISLERAVDLVAEILNKISINFSSTQQSFSDNHICLKSRHYPVIFFDGVVKSEGNGRPSAIYAKEDAKDMDQTLIDLFTMESDASFDANYIPLILTTLSICGKENQNEHIKRLSEYFEQSEFDLSTPDILYSISASLIKYRCEIQRPSITKILEKLSLCAKTIQNNARSTLISPLVPFLQMGNRLEEVEIVGVFFDNNHSLEFKTLHRATIPEKELFFVVTCKENDPRVALELSAQLNELIREFSCVYQNVYVVSSHPWVRLHSPARPTHNLYAGFNPPLFPDFFGKGAELTQMFWKDVLDPMFLALYGKLEISEKFLFATIFFAKFFGDNSNGVFEEALSLISCSLDVFRDVTLSAINCFFYLKNPYFEDRDDFGIDLSLKNFLDDFQALKKTEADRQGWSWRFSSIPDAARGSSVFQSIFSVPIHSIQLPSSLVRFLDAAREVVWTLSNPHYSLSPKTVPVVINFSGYNIILENYIIFYLISFFGFKHPSNVESAEPLKQCPNPYPSSFMFDRIAAVERVSKPHLLAYKPVNLEEFKEMLENVKQESRKHSVGVLFDTTIMTTDWSKVSIDLIQLGFINEGIKSIIVITRSGATNTNEFPEFTYESGAFALKFPTFSEENIREFLELNICNLIALSEEAPPGGQRSASQASLALDNQDSYMEFSKKLISVFEHVSDSHPSNLIGTFFFISNLLSFLPLDAALSLAIRSMSHGPVDTRELAQLMEPFELGISELSERLSVFKIVHSLLDVKDNYFFPFVFQSYAPRQLAVKLGTLLPDNSVLILNTGDRRTDPTELIISKINSANTDKYQPFLFIILLENPIDMNEDNAVTRLLRAYLSPFPQLPRPRENKKIGKYPQWITNVPNYGIQFVMISSPEAHESLRFFQCGSPILIKEQPPKEVFLESVAAKISTRVEELRGGWTLKVEETLELLLNIRNFLKFEGKSFQRPRNRLENLRDYIGRLSPQFFAQEIEQCARLIPSAEKHMKPFVANLLGELIIQEAKSFGNICFSALQPSAASFYVCVSSYVQLLRRQKKTEAIGKRAFERITKIKAKVAKLSTLQKRYETEIVEAAARVEKTKRSLENIIVQNEEVEAELQLSLPKLSKKRYRVGLLASEVIEVRGFAKPPSLVKRILDCVAIVLSVGDLLPTRPHILDYVPPFQHESYAEFLQPKVPSFFEVISPPSCKAEDTAFGNRFIQSPKSPRDDSLVDGETPTLQDKFFAPVDSFSVLRPIFHSDASFVNRILTFDPDCITREQIELLLPYLASPDFTPEHGGKTARPVRGLIEWLFAVIDYHIAALRTQKTLQKSFNFKKELRKVRVNLRTCTRRLEVIQNSQIEASKREKRYVTETEQLQKRILEAENQIQTFDLSLGDIFEEIRQRETSLCTTIDQCLGVGFYTTLSALLLLDPECAQEVCLLDKNAPSTLQSPNPFLERLFSENSLKILNELEVIPAPPKMFGFSAAFCHVHKIMLPMIRAVGGAHFKERETGSLMTFAALTATPLVPVIPDPHLFVERVLSHYYGSVMTVFSSLEELVESEFISPITVLRLSDLSMFRGAYESRFLRQITELSFNASVHAKPGDKESKLLILLDRNTDELQDLKTALMSYIAPIRLDFSTDAIPFILHSSISTLSREIARTCDELAYVKEQLAVRYQDLQLCFQEMVADGANLIESDLMAKLAELLKGINDLQTPLQANCLELSTRLSQQLIEQTQWKHVSLLIIFASRVLSIPLMKLFDTSVAAHATAARGAPENDLGQFVQQVFMNSINVVASHPHALLVALLSRFTLTLSESDARGLFDSIDSRCAASPDTSSAAEGSSQESEDSQDELEQRIKAVPTFAESDQTSYVNAICDLVSFAKCSTNLATLSQYFSRQISSFTLPFTVTDETVEPFVYSVGALPPSFRLAIALSLSRRLGCLTVVRDIKSVATFLRIRRFVQNITTSAPSWSAKTDLELSVCTISARRKVTAATIVALLHDGKFVLLEICEGAIRDAAVLLQELGRIDADRMPLDRIALLFPPGARSLSVASRMFRKILFDVPPQPSDDLCERALEHYLAFPRYVKTSFADFGRRSFPMVREDFAKEISSLLRSIIASSMASTAPSTLELAVSSLSAFLNLHLDGKQFGTVEGTDIPLTGKTIESSLNMLVVISEMFHFPEA